MVIAQVKAPAEITMMHFAYARAQLGKDPEQPLRQQLGNVIPLTLDVVLRIYWDGETNASVEFRGLEDAFGFSWGLPASAVFFPLTGYLPFLNGAAAYRFFLSDSISFNQSLKVTIGFSGRENYWLRHFSKTDTAVQLSSTVYWYQTEPHTPLPTLPPPDDRAPTPMATFRLMKVMEQ